MSRELPARLIVPIGWRLQIGLRQKGACPGDAYGLGHWGVTALDVALDDPRQQWELREIPPDLIPASCAHCGAALTDQSLRSFGARRRYATPDGRPQPGDLFWSQHEPPHLLGVTPSGHTWDIDGPSSTGGGWTRTGDPPLVSVTPSIWIQVPRGYHGFLTNGVWTPDLEGRDYA